MYNKKAASGEAAFLLYVTTGLYLMHESSTDRHI